MYGNGYHRVAKDLECSRYGHKGEVALENEAASAFLWRELLDKEEVVGTDYLRRAAMLNFAFAQSILGYSSASR